jgi:hypothetical protein
MDDIHRHLPAAPANGNGRAARGAGNKIKIL